MKRSKKKSATELRVCEGPAAAAAAPSCVWRSHAIDHTARQLPPLQRENSKEGEQNSEAVTLYMTRHLLSIGLSLFFSSAHKKLFPEARQNTYPVLLCIFICYYIILHNVSQIMFINVRFVFVPLGYDVLECQWCTAWMMLLSQQ